MRRAEYLIDAPQKLTSQPTRLVRPAMDFPARRPYQSVFIGQCPIIANLSAAPTKNRFVEIL